MNLSLRQRLEDGQPCLGVSLRLARTMDWAAIMRDAGYHWLFLDLEHGTMSFDTLSQMALAGIEAGIFPLVRTPDHDPAPMNRILSNGGMGIIAPHVETADQARAIARACRFAPLGERSVPGAFPALGYQPLGFDKGAEILNRETLVVVMIESPAALENVDEIAAVEGVDVLLVGASDLTFAMGLPSQYGHPRIREAMQQVADAARNAGKFSGFGGVADAALARDYMAFGHQLVLAGNDLAMVLRGARARAEDLIG
tara:strand:- start:850 stop:1617 length:768 start_codon:yes stop_codon:yes gene_type:complete